MFIPTVMTELLNHPQNLYLVISDIKSITQFFEFMSLPNMDYVEYGWTKGRFGIDIKTHDCHFSDCVMINCHTAIICSGTNVFDRIHARMGSNGKWLENSVFFNI